MIDKLLDIIKSGINNVLLIVSLLAATLFPGYIIILLFGGEMVNKLDSIKLTILSFGFTVPLLILNIIITTVPYFADNSEKDFNNNSIELNNLMLFLKASVMNIFSLYISLFDCWLHGEDVKNFINIVSNIELSVLLFCVSMLIQRVLCRYIKIKNVFVCNFILYLIFFLVGLLFVLNNWFFKFN